MEGCITIKPETRARIKGYLEGFIQGIILESLFAFYVESTTQYYLYNLLYRSDTFSQMPSREPSLPSI